MSGISISTHHPLLLVKNDTPSKGTSATTFLNFEELLKYAGVNTLNGKYKTLHFENYWGQRFKDDDGNTVALPKTFKCFDDETMEVIFAVSNTKTLREHGSSTDITEYTFIDLEGNEIKVERILYIYEKDN